MITLQARTPGAFGAPSIVNDDGRSVLVQGDRDYPGIASSFGWSVTRVRRSVLGVMCSHDGTDGTIDCGACGHPAGGFIDSARDWIDAHDGATATDPGYFNAD